MGPQTYWGHDLDHCVITVEAVVMLYYYTTVLLHTTVSAVYCSLRISDLSGF